MASTACLGILTTSVRAQDITYQGLLSDQGGPANGLYEMKFQFRQPGPPPILFDPPIVLPVLVSDGRFTTQLDTAGVPVRDPAPLELVICVRRLGEEVFVQLDPPQPITPAPRAIAAETANNVPASGLPANVALTDDPPIFTVPLSGPRLLLPQPDSNVVFGPTGECTIGIDPRFAGLSETDPNGFRLLGQNLEGCRLLFGPTDDCTIEVAPPGAGPGGLLLRDPRCIRVLPPDPSRQPGTFYFGPTDLCSLGIDAPGGLTGLVERDPVGLRLAGQDQIGCRLLFGPDDLCTVEIDPNGPTGLLLRDPRGIRILPPPGLLAPPRLLFGPTDECSIGLIPDLPGLAEQDPTGFRLLGRNQQGCRLIFGPTMDCTVEVDPSGPAGLLLRDPNGIRVLNPIPEGPARLLFGPTDDCSLGIDPQLPGLVERDPTGFRLLGQDEQGCRLIFGPTMDCTVEVNPQGPAGLLLRDPRGIRILDPRPTGVGAPILRFGPTDDCSIGLDPQLPGLAERDPTGFRLLGRDNQGCRLIFGPTMDCTVEVDPKGPAGLLLRDPNGIRILNPDPSGNPIMRFGPTDDCSILADPERGLLLRDPRGITLPFPTDPAGKLLPAVLTMGDLGECRWKVNAPDQGPPGMILEDPNGLLLVTPEGRPSALAFGPTGECRITVGPLPNQRVGMIFDDPNGFLFQNPLEPGGAQLLVGGAVFANEFVQTSSRRYKENVQPIGDPLAKLEQLQGVTFDWDQQHGGTSSLGFIAEEVGKVFPEVVAYEGDGVTARGLNYGHLVAVTVEGIKAQQDQIEHLEKENNQLKDSLETMRAQMEALAAKVNALSAQ